MIDLYDSITNISRVKNIGIMFSCGRDSIVMIDLFMKYAKKSVSKIVFMYYCPDMSFDEKILQYYEKRYSIKIERIPHFDVSYMLNDNKKHKKLKMSDSEKLIKKEYELLYLAFGYRKDESLQRRGMLSNLPYNIDAKYKRIYPLADWSKKHVEKYVKSKKLVLPAEYAYGYRDINTFKGSSILYIYNNYPDDYKKIIKMFPDVEGELMRAQQGLGNG